MRFLRSRTRTLLAGWAAIALVGTGFACGRGAEPTPEEPAEEAAAEAPAPAAAAPSAELQAEAKQLFDQRCTACHGALGKGDGPKSEQLDTMPRNYQDPGWQDSISDEEIATAILYGGEATGSSAEMPGNPDLVDREELVAALVAYIRTFRR